jgi:3-oxoacyl-[acyl-carrier-protein] synthase II
VNARAVVITGCGLVTPAGNELSSFWRALTSGACFIRPLQSWSCPGLTGLLGAESSVDPCDSVDVRGPRARCDALAHAAARRALEDSGLVDDVEREAMGVVVGTTLGSENEVAALDERVIAAGPAALDAGFLERCDNHQIGARVAARFGLGGPVIVNATACASGNAALSWAYEHIASGETHAMIAGGVDTFTRLIFCGFSRMGALSKSRCRPFDKNRDGVSFGEGAGFVVLEDREHARARGAHVYAELAGYGISNDAYHLTAPEQSGEGFARAMEQALASTATSIEEVSYVSAHGTGTPYNDLGETLAMKAVFGSRAPRVPISSIKSMIGHTNGAASAIETIACILALQHQMIPPTVNLSEPDPALDLDYVPDRARAAIVDTCLNLAAGFGGFNVCTVIRAAR